MKKCLAAIAATGLFLAACSGASESTATTPTSASSSSSAPSTTAAVTETTTPAPDGTQLLAAAASRSVLPTVGGARDYLTDAPGWTDPVDSANIGVFVPTWDQGVVDVGNGEGDGSWVHDDLRTTALVLQKVDTQVIMITADLYMLFAFDQDEIERRLREQLPPDFADAQIIISATHNHHGPDSAFSINDEWFDQAANEMVGAAMDAITNGLLPARMTSVAGEHRFGQSDQRDPLIVDPRLNVLQVLDVETGDAIATVVQWASHPETTLGWNPPGDIAAECATKGWTGDDCSADGRYFTADYPGIVRERVQAAGGGEVLYYNGALGNQIGPGRADVWQIDDAHPIGDGVAAPDGAQPVPGAADLRDRNLARTAAIGNALADHVLELIETATEVTFDDIEYRQQSFFTRLTNIGFRVLLADGDLGWQVPTVYNCTGKPFAEDNCTEDGGESVDDPLLTPLVESQIRKGDVFKTRVTWLRFGDVGFLFMPGELPPELVIGLPADFVTDTAKYFEFPEMHATGEDYAIPGALLDLVPTSQTFTVGLGGDELGYWVPLNEYRLKCMDLEIPADTGYTCQRLFDEGLLVSADAVAGPTCRALTDEPPVAPTAAQQALASVCRYGQALGRELGEPEDHYEETNAAGWDLVDDLWTAATQLFKG
ncbi:MAG: hypothetical protein HY828_20070 [Actinobacteria bacterium]|nr:hypothetical protein [Actinomycetota bacterium]